MDKPSSHLPTHTEAEITRELNEAGFNLTAEPKLLTVSGEFHRIWLVDLCRETSITHSLSDVTNSEVKSFQAILRVSGPHIPEIKTQNEIGVLEFLRYNTHIPVPSVLHFSSTTDNSVGAEYALISRIPGVIASEIYDSITEAQMDAILNQLVDIQLELYRIPWHHVGGLKVDPAGQPGKVIPGSPVDEWRWMVPDIDRFFCKSETYESLNPTSSKGYDDFSAWLTAHVSKYMHAISVHPHLKSWLGPSELSLLERYLVRLQEPDLQAKIDDVPLRLAHRDLHFGNIMLDPSSRYITGILDWEFSQVLPLPLWRHSFLWDGRQGRCEGAKYSANEKERLYRIWEGKVWQRGQAGRSMLKAMKWKFQEQEAAWDVCNYLRCIVEVCPRGVQMNDAMAWWREVVTACAVLKVKLFSS